MIGEIRKHIRILLKFISEKHNVNIISVAKSYNFIKDWESHLGICDNCRVETTLIDDEVCEECYGKIYAD